LGASDQRQREVELAVLVGVVLMWLVLRMNWSCYFGGGGGGGSWNHLFEKKGIEGKVPQWQQEKFKSALSRSVMAKSPGKMNNHTQALIHSLQECTSPGTWRSAQLLPSQGTSSAPLPLNFRRTLPPQARWLLLATHYLHCHYHQSWCCFQTVQLLKASSGGRLADGRRHKARH
jgi:hypothetical protein